MKSSFGGRAHFVTGFTGAANNGMDLRACIQGVKRAMRHLTFNSPIVSELPSHPGVIPDQDPRRKVKEVCIDVNVRLRKAAEAVFRRARLGVEPFRVISYSNKRTREARRIEQHVCDLTRFGWCDTLPYDI
jgi:hypothetical protein